MKDDVRRHAVPSQSDSRTVTNEVDKRRHARIPVSVSAEVIEIQTGTRVPGRATDVGVGGCYIDCLNTFREGAEVEVLLYWRGNTLKLRALVSYVAGGRSIGMGLSFTGTSAHQDATLLDWLTGGSDDVSPKPMQESAPEALAASGEGGMKAKSAGATEALDDLIGLLVRKQVLTASEGARIRDRLWRPNVPDAP